MRSPIVPETSTTLLRDIVDPRHQRWSVFVARYEPMMRTYLHERFPSLDADEIVQMTFVALAEVLPCYVYAPDEKGRFRIRRAGAGGPRACRCAVRGYAGWFAWLFGAYNEVRYRGPETLSDLMQLQNLECYHK